MSIPDYQTIMLPLLKLAATHLTIKFRDAVTFISDEFKLTDQEKIALLPSGKNTVIYSRTSWAATYLSKAGLIARQRGIMDITERGKKVLAENPTAVNVKYLTKFQEFVEFYKSTTEESTVTANSADSVINVSRDTPEETIEDAYIQLKNQALQDIIECLKSCSPQFFERVVVDTVVKMGYGGSRRDAGKAIGKSGDEGIDGIINEDRLGLDVIYLQAKRWEGNISRPEIQKFAGALQGKRAKKGIFITTSSFTSEAREFVKHIDSKIILISGKELAELMWEHNIGLNTSVTYDVKKLDLDYFSE